MLKWKLVMVRLEMVLNLKQDRCTVCAERTIGSKFILDIPMELRAEMVLILPQDRCTVCAERTIDSKIVLDAPDGTPR
jgi:hypothetical protein